MRKERVEESYWRLERRAWSRYGLRLKGYAPGNGGFHILLFVLCYTGERRRRAIGCHRCSCIYRRGLRELVSASAGIGGVRERRERGLWRALVKNPALAGFPADCSKSEENTPCSIFFFTKFQALYPQMMRMVWALHRKINRLLCRNLSEPWAVFCDHSHTL